MQATLVSAIGLSVCLACGDATPPLVHPVVHDATLTFTRIRFDGSTMTHPMNQAFTGTLAIDFGTSGARFDMATTPPCISSQGAVTRAGASVSGEFHRQDYSPRLTLSGTLDSTGVINGSFTCYSHWGGSPHHDTYTGTFKAIPRP